MRLCLLNSPQLDVEEVLGVGIQVEDEMLTRTRSFLAWRPRGPLGSPWLKVRALAGHTVGSAHSLPRPQTHRHEFSPPQPRGSEPCEAPGLGTPCPCPLSAHHSCLPFKAQHRCPSVLELLCLPISLSRVVAASLFPKAEIPKGTEKGVVPRVTFSWQCKVERTEQPPAGPALG